MALTAILL